MDTTHTPSVILTRPEAQSREFAQRLRVRFGDAFEVEISPVGRVEYLSPDIDQDRYGTFLFTSVNGVGAITSSHDLSGRTAYCVGDRTADQARTAGMDACSAGGTANDLLDLVQRERPPTPWIYVSGEDVRIDLAQSLSSAGYPTDRCIAYRHIEQPLTDRARELFQKGGVIVPVFSPRSAAILSGMVPTSASKVEVFALSRAVAEAWGGALGRIHVAKRPNAEEMMKLFELRL